MQVIKSENYNQYFSKQSLRKLGAMIQKLERESICNTCIIKYVN